MNGTSLLILGVSLSVDARARPSPPSVAIVPVRCEHVRPSQHAVVRERPRRTRSKSPVSGGAYGGGSATSAGAAADGAAGAGRALLSSMRSLVYHKTPVMATTKPNTLCMVITVVKTSTPSTQMMIVLEWPTTWKLRPAGAASRPDDAATRQEGPCQTETIRNDPCPPSARAHGGARSYVTALVLASIMADEKFIGAASRHEIRIHVWRARLHRAESNQHARQSSAKRGPDHVRDRAHAPSRYCSGPPQRG